MKHESGSVSFKFEDQLDICEAPQHTVMDNTKSIYFMENLNPKIFEHTIIIWKIMLTRASFPETYAEPKTYMAVAQIDMLCTN